MRSEEQQRLYSQGSRLYSDGEYERALELFDRVAQDRPNSKHVIYSRAMCMIALDRLREAREVARRLEGFRGTTAQRLRMKVDRELDAARLGKEGGAGYAGADRRQAEERRQNGERREARERHRGEERRQDRDRRQVQQPRRGPERREGKDRRHLFRRIEDRLRAARLPERLDPTHGSAAQRTRAMWKLVVFGGLAAACVAGFIYLAFGRPQVGQVSREAALEAEFAALDGPDKYLSVIEFFPADTSRSYEFAMFLAPAEGESPGAGKEINNCVGARVAADWETVLTRTGKAFAMCRNRTGRIGGVPQDNMVRTLVLPHDVRLLTDMFQGRALEMFASGSAPTLSAVVSGCGGPDHVESWVGRARLTGINGETHWWGRVGIAADENGVITHLLVRSYPKA